MKKTGVAVALLVALGSVAACSDQRAPSEHTATTNAPIQGGSDDGTAHPFAVGFCIDVPGNGTVDCNNLNVDICSGALIAPNLVVTARHCVQNTDKQIDCASSVFSGQLANNFYVTTDPTFTGATHWHTVSSINVPTPTSVCGNDIALLTLQDDVPAAEATPITPVVQYPMTTHPMYSRQVTAVGYGATQAGTNPPGAGTRRIKGAIPIECVVGDTDFAGCDTVFDSGTIDPKEFITGDGTCQG
ncbi:MAG: trypsin-like serine protease, partial [Polyangiaceae bacterium]